MGEILSGTAGHGRRAELTCDQRPISALAAGEPHAVQSSEQKVTPSYDKLKQLFRV